MTSCFGAIAPTGLTAGVHNEDDEAVRTYMEQVKASGVTDYRAHGLSRPPITELLAMHTIFETGADTGCPAHVVHCSLGRGYDIARAYRRDGFEATVENIRELEPDHVVLATGSTWRTDGYTVKMAGRPGIPGLEHVEVRDPIQALESPERCGDRVLIVDDTGEYTALGLAETLAGLGKTVEVVGASMFLGENTLLNLDIGHLYPRLHAAGVTLTPQHVVGAVTEEGAVLTRAWDGESRTVPVDSIVTVMLRDSETSLLAGLKAEFDVTEIGDCVAPRRVDEAIYEGEMAGRAI